MKKTLFFVLTMMVATICFAQQQFATLNHNDTLSAFYGAGAFKEAYNAAVGGDNITLSSGTFLVENTFTIEKGITIRGNGMMDDTLANTTQTVISANGYIKLNVTDTVNHLVLEGVSFPLQVYMVNLASPQFYKCYINQIVKQGGNVIDATFTNCNINKISLSSSITNPTFVNCIINEINALSGYGTFNASYVQGFKLFNCLAGIPNGYYSSNSSIPCFTCNNCILFSPNAITSQPSNTFSCYNCIGIGRSSDSTMYYFNNSNNNNRNFATFDAVFKYFAGGTYSFGMDMSLLDSIAANILGTDGTQVGVYGGMVPYEPRLNTPRFVRANVAPHTTLDGKLSVDIEVVSE